MALGEERQVSLFLTTNGVPTFLSFTVNSLAESDEVIHASLVYNSNIVEDEMFSFILHTEWPLYIVMYMRSVWQRGKCLHLL